MAALLALIVIGAILLWSLSIERRAWIVWNGFDTPGMIDTHWLYIDHGRWGLSHSAAPAASPKFWASLRDRYRGARFESLPRGPASDDAAARWDYGVRQTASGTEFLGFRWRRSTSPTSPKSVELIWSVPFSWTVLVTAAPLVTIGWRRRRARRAARRARLGLCLGCGYDLRGNPAGDRCPECGTPVVKPAAAEPPPAPADASG